MQRPLLWARGSCNPARADLRGYQKKGAVVMHTFLQFFSDDAGSTAIEYALIASGVALAILAAVNALGGALAVKYQEIGGKIQ
jgi:pilus assembly protein Flp/PilA